MGRLNVPVEAFALDEPEGAEGSGALRVVSLGTEFVVETLGGRPGWKGAPPARPRLLVPFLMGDLSLYCGEVMPEPPIGMSPEVGVGKEL